MKPIIIGIGIVTILIGLVLMTYSEIVMVKIGGFYVPLPVRRYPYYDLGAIILLIGIFTAVVGVLARPVSEKEKPVEIY